MEELHNSPFGLSIYTGLYIVPKQKINTIMFISNIRFCSLKFGKKRVYKTTIRSLIDPINEVRNITFKKQKWFRSTKFRDVIVKFN